MKYRITPKAPQVNTTEKAGFSPEFAPDIFEGTTRYPYEKFGKMKILLSDYLNGYFNPLVSSMEYYEFEFDRKDISVRLSGGENSISSLFSVLMFKAFARVFPKCRDVISCKFVHNPASALGLPDAHENFLAHIVIP